MVFIYEACVNNLFYVVIRDNKKIGWLCYRSNIHSEEIQIHDSEEGNITVQLQTSVCSPAMCHTTRQHRE
jgi:hypothetical protein